MRKHRPPKVGSNLEKAGLIQPLKKSRLFVSKLLRLARNLEFTLHRCFIYNLELEIILSPELPFKFQNLKPIRARNFGFDKII